MNYIADETFKGKNYTKTRLPKGEYEHCVFEQCDFSNGYLDNQNFSECVFTDCNLSNANIKYTLCNDVRFSHCKLLGLKFEDLNDFLIRFQCEDCTLNLASFYGLTLKNVIFKDCKFLKTDFTNADLTNALFDNCNLQGAIFENTILERADFRTAYHIGLDPERNKLRKAKFSKEGALGLLLKYDLIVE
jgi:uncharacterized protein YjbI with pentapeptide repeats